MVDQGAGNPPPDASVCHFLFGIGERRSDDAGCGFERQVVWHSALGGRRLAAPICPAPFLSKPLRLCFTMRVIRSIVRFECRIAIQPRELLSHRCDGRE